MKKRLVMILAMFAVSGSLLACGSQSTDVQETVEVVVEEATPMPEEVVSPETEIEKSKEVEKEVEVVEEVVEEPVEVVPTWYMNEEGIVNEELGVMIRRDSAEWSEFGFSGSYAVNISKRELRNVTFSCYYYEGDIDSYISEHEGTKKRTLENLVCAVEEANEYGAGGMVAFVGNGVVISVDLRDYKIEEIFDTRFKNGLESCEEEQTSYLAYIKDNVLYCPSLGIKLSGAEDEPIYDNYVLVDCVDGGGSIHMYSESYGGTAEDRINEYVTSNLEFLGEGSAIEENVDRKFGNYKFIGRGYSAKYDDKSWMFASDEIPYEIRIWYIEEYELDKYLSLIEELK